MEDLAEYFASMLLPVCRALEPVRLHMMTINMLSMEPGSMVTAWVIDDD